MFDAFAEIQPNKESCIVPGDLDVYQTPRGIVGSGAPTFQNIIAGTQPLGGSPCTESGQMTWVPISGGCKIANYKGYTGLTSGERGKFQLMECSIDDYILPMTVLVIGFSYHRLRKKLTVV